MKQTTEEQALNRLEAMCAKAEHCMAEAQAKMRMWGLAPDAQQRVAERLVANGYIDDARYARALANDKARYDRWGPRKIGQALYAKRIDQQAIDDALADIPHELHLDNLRHLLAAKRRELGRKTPGQYGLYAKLVRFALGRGFDMDDIRRCIGDDGGDCGD